VWKMVPTCILWCLWGEMNDRSFEDQEMTMDEILSLFFKTLYLWTVAYVTSLSISHHISLLFLLLLVNCFFLYIPCVLRGTLRF
jgi:Ca2+/Na+ antiporter